MSVNKNITFERIANWIDRILKSLKIEAKAFNFNIYTNENNYSIELTATASFDEDNEDWSCDEIYASREDENEYYFNSKNWESALEFTKNAIKYYLDNGKYADKLKNSCAVACGFVDGDLTLLYVR